MKKILSIVVPAYNVEKYIEQCLASFEVPEILDLLEVIIVNDGSKDRTPEIAKQYCQKYPDTYFLFNKENGGHGSGINYGIKYATGKYFKVVDGDDWINKDEIVKFVDTLKKQETDIVASDFCCIQDETGKVLSHKNCTLDPKQYGTIGKMSKGEINNIIKMHALTIKTSILKQMDRKIDENCYYVDCEYILYPMDKVESVYFYQGDIYMYRLGRDGQSMNIKSMQKNREQHMRVLESLLEYYDSLSTIGENNKKYIEMGIGQVVENQFQIFISMGLKKGIRNELIQWDTNLKETHYKIYNATGKRSISLLRKTHYMILPFGTIAYKIVKRGKG